jgi:LPS sulfotransferase NodH
MRYSELQISSDLLDQPQCAATPKKLIICSTPRSGSYLLSRHMINAGLGVPHEYFNPVVIHQMAPRLGLGERAANLKWWTRGRRDQLGLRRKERAAEADFLRAYLSILLARRCQGGVFAAKVHFRDFRRVLDNPIGNDLLDGAVFVHLYREDLLKQAVSEHFSQLTGQWGIDGTITTPPAENPDFFDTEAIERALVDISEQDRGWRVLIARLGAVPMSISYERLCEDPFGFVEAIARRIGVDPSTLRRGYSEAPTAAAPTPGFPDKTEMAQRYLAAMGARPTTSLQT